MDKLDLIHRFPNQIYPLPGLSHLVTSTKLQAGDSTLQSRSESVAWTSTHSDSRRFLETCDSDKKHKKHRVLGGLSAHSAIQIKGDSILAHSTLSTPSTPKKPMERLQPLHPPPRRRCPEIRWVPDSKRIQKWAWLVMTSMTSIRFN